MFLAPVKRKGMTCINSCTGIEITGKTTRPRNEWKIIFLRGKAPAMVNLIKTAAPAMMRQNDQ